MTDTDTRIAAQTKTIPAVAGGWDLVEIWPGLLLTAVIAALSFGLRDLPGVAILSPMILSILIGIVLHNSIGTPRLAKPGVTFCVRRVLRFAIILLGLQLTAAQIAEVGAGGIVIIAATLVATFLFTIWFGRMIGVDRKLSQLIAAGTSICGASAVIATNTVTDAHDEDVAYAVACVTVFGSIAMFVYPLFPGLLHLDAHAYGLWAGASIHEIAQVMAAAYQDGQQAGDAGAIAKLSRVAMLAPVVIVLGVLATRRTEAGDRTRPAAKPPMPWFVLGFIALVGVNSVITVPPDAKAAIILVTTFLMSMALAAMGLETDVAKLRAKGIRPLILGFVAFLFVAIFSLSLIETMG
ncbi:MAG: YeiH family protein [Hyphomicrobium sp.]|uniref:YeiH family protein n=1 Tax=Hyphomicrobium sp. TaxID=82 RepID=UPI0035614628